MRTALSISIVLIVAFGIVGECRAQIKATTSDGKKVLLSFDGTWKYDLEEIEKDSSLLKNLSMVNDSSSLRKQSDANAFP